MLTYPYIFGINFTWSWGILYIIEFNLLKLFFGFLHLYLSDIGLFFLYVYLFLYQVMVASKNKLEGRPFSIF